MNPDVCGLSRRSLPFVTACSLHFCCRASAFCRSSDGKMTISISITDKLTKTVSHAPHCMVVSTARGKGRVEAWYHQDRLPEQRTESGGGTTKMCVIIGTIRELHFILYSSLECHCFVVVVSVYMAILHFIMHAPICSLSAVQGWPFSKFPCFPDADGFWMCLSNLYYWWVFQSWSIDSR